MKQHLIAALSVAALFLSGCAIGPLVLHETARPVGKTNHELDGGLGSAGYVFKWNYGATENLDIGLHWESLSLGLRAKYAFINGYEHGWSLAGALGAGQSIGGSHVYADIITSYMNGAWEPYGALRFVRATIDPTEFRDSKNNSFSFTIDRTSYDYGQAMLGSRYWFNQRWMGSAELSTLFSLTKGLNFENTLLLGFAVGYRF